MILTPPTDFVSILYSFFLWIMEFFGNNLPAIMLYLGISIFAGYIFYKLSAGFWGRL